MVVKAVIICATEECEVTSKRKLTHLLGASVIKAWWVKHLLISGLCFAASFK